MQHIEQLALVEGQLEYRRESGGQRIKPLNIGVARDRKYGGGCRVRSRASKALRELRIFARAVEHRAVIGLRQADFGDEPRHTGLDVRDRDRRGPPAREHTVERLALGLREADEQDPGASELASAGTLGLLLQLQLDPEGAAEADRAFQPDLAPHQADELLRDGSAQACAAGGIPIPVSRTENLRRTLDSVSLCADTCTVTLPRSVNFTALPARLIRTCRR